MHDEGDNILNGLKYSSPLHDLWRKVEYRVEEADNLVSEKDGLPVGQFVFKKRKALRINNEKKLQEKRSLVYLSVGCN